ncbi:4Fe-4S binding protein [Vogesella indigofera]|uniref:4Fe-4S binding protein n=1 Tax=Vogesella indigofera TaxID=45465 RepID=UPI00234EF3C6|nr:4Fe-4S binding protein [Vogesella indigofera]MDC7701190.1 4Fe-4S binding protein [Vogesella indigofera]
MKPHDCTTAPAARPWLARVGDGLQRHAPLIRRLQWLVVAVYLLLIVLPVLTPLPDETAHLWNHVTLIAQFAFWGIWWPFVLLSMVLFGRLWCGVLCPEGALSEWAARHGKARPIPRWLRWPGWPFTAFVLTTVYGQMVSVYQYPQAVLLVLGGSTVAAVWVGYYYTRGKRAWCRYLCPVNGVFALLAKLAPLHFRVSEQAWQASLDNKRVLPIKAVDCAPLLPIRQMEGASGCHMCGRCSSHRDAVTLSARSPADEVVRLGARDADGWQSALILFGLLGVAIGAFHWSASPWFVTLRTALAEWLIERDLLWPLDADAPWWLLTNYPLRNDVFSWLDGGLLLAYIAATAIALGGLCSLLLAAAVACHGWQRQRFHHLVQALIPLAGCGVFLGLTTVTLSLLRSEHIVWPWVNDVRLLLLLGANGWSLWLAARIGAGWQRSRLRQALALLPFCAALLWIDSAWGWLFWWW